MTSTVQVRVLPGSPSSEVYMLLSFLIGCGLGYIGYQAALVIVGYFQAVGRGFESLQARHLGI